jgi:hypothetical protein
LSSGRKQTQFPKRRVFYSLECRAMERVQKLSNPVYLKMTGYGPDDQDPIFGSDTGYLLATMPGPPIRVTLPPFSRYRGQRVTAVPHQIPRLRMDRAQAGAPLRYTAASAALIRQHTAPYQSLTDLVPHDFGGTARRKETTRKSYIILKCILER